jgi:hypothetical protein
MASSCCATNALNSMVSTVRRLALYDKVHQNHFNAEHKPPGGDARTSGCAPSCRDNNTGANILGHGDGVHLGKPELRTYLCDYTRERCTWIVAFRFRQILFREARAM